MGAGALAMLLAWGDPAGASQAATPATSAAATVPVAVLARPVTRGELLTADDLAIEDRNAAQARGALGVQEIAGREANRNLSAGAVLRANDVVARRLVRRGEPVTINIRAGGLVISSVGRALASGGEGDLVRVVCTATNRTLDGVVESSGAVRVSAP